MIDKKKASLSAFKEKTAGRLPSLDKVDVKGKALKAGEAIGGKAMEIKESAMAKKEDITEKLTELDRMLESSITQYNDAYTLMNDRGVQLFIERTRSVDMIGLVEVLVNSIANRPKSFDSEFDEIRTNRAVFLNACDFGERQLQAAREAAGGAGAGIAAGASVAFMAPTAAMWRRTDSWRRRYCSRECPACHGRTCRLDHSRSNTAFIDTDLFKEEGETKPAEK